MKRDQSGNDEFSDLDVWMSRLPLETTSHEYTQRIVSSSILKKKRRSGLRLVLVTSGFFFFGTMLCLMLINDEALSRETQLDLILRDFGFSFSPISEGIISRESFLIMEGMLCLFVLERLLSKLKSRKLAGAKSE